MYFLRIEALKQELRAAPMSGRRALPYLVVWFVLMAVATQSAWLIGTPSTNQWDYVSAAGTVLASLLGLLSAYHANGGADGQDLPARVLSLSWVLGWRLVVPVVVVAGVALAVLDPAMLADPAPPTSPLEVALVLGCQVLFFWRLSAHLRQIGKTAWVVVVAT